AESAYVSGRSGETRLGQESSELGGRAVASINSSINWFTGTDASQIGRRQFDYQTTVTHELLHLVGLDDDDDDIGAVTQGVLGYGEVRRTLSLHDEAELAEAYRASAPWQSPAIQPIQVLAPGQVRYKAESLIAVPEPATLGLVVVGGLALLCRRR
ncbi:MAG: PEP-CTERM sorting domain-containing protein, partial [Phycisphaeraceae bacterium]